MDRSGQILAHPYRAWSLALLVFAVSSCRTPTEAERFAAWTVQDQRRDENGLLVELLAKASPQVRLQAARAMGALRSRAYAEPLGRALREDDSAWVRHAATFSLGQLEGRGHGDQVIPALTAAELSLRSLGATALGRVGSPEHLALLAPLLQDPAAVVRGAAALAVLDLAGDRYRKEALTEGLEPSTWQAITQALEDQVRRETSPKAKWQETYALAHLALPNARKTLLDIAKTRVEGGDPDRRWARVFAIHGLSTLPAGEDIATLEAELLRDEDPAIVIAAMRAAVTPRRPEGDNSPILGTALLKLLDQSTTSAVRETAAILLRKFPDLTIPETVGETETSIVVRAALLETRILRANQEVYGALFDQWVSALDNNAPPIMMAAFARHLHRAPTTAAPRSENQLTQLDLCTWFAISEDNRVKLGLLENAHLIDGRLGADICVTIAKAMDPARREALAESIAKFPDDHPQHALLIDLLRKAFAQSKGPEYAEARKSMVRVIAEASPNSAETTSFLETALQDPDYIVRKSAATALEKAGSRDGKVALREPGQLFTPYPGKELPANFMQSHPQLTLHTSQGKIVINLFPQLAPIHCFNLMTLAMRGDYDGRSFHRVVPNFVVQGGSARPDGYANRAWNGKQIRDEINPLRFTSGVVGMPKSSDPDTGGDQIFITLLPTPHLDGKYTAFGRVTEGMDVVESIEVGAIIEKTDVHLR